MDFNFLALPQFERLNNGGGKPNGQAITPFGDLHFSS
jgi:hypothetical protein